MVQGKVVKGRRLQRQAGAQDRTPASLLLGLAGLAASCAGPHAGPAGGSRLPSDAPQQGEQPAASAATPDSSAALSPTRTDVVLAAQTSADPEAATASLAPACGQMCDRLADTCSDEDVDACRLNCTSFEQVDVRCQAVGQSAFGCARDAGDLLCIQVAPASCLDAFKAYQGCTRDPESYAPTEASRAQASSGPELQAARHGFRAELPVAGQWSPAQTLPNAGARWSADTPEGYWVVTATSVPDGLTLPQRLMRAAESVAPECRGALRLHGQYESPGAVHVAFSGTCKDSAVWRGAAHLYGKQAYVTAVRGAANETDSVRFFESFQHP